MRWRAPLALLAGLGHATSFAPFSAGWVQLLSLAAAWSLVVGLGPWAGGVPRTRQAATIGLLFGLGSFTAGLCWLYVSMHDFGGMPAPLAALAVVLLSAYLALFGALAFALAHRWRGPGNAPTWRTAVLLGALWCAGELLRGYLFTGFPWLSIGYAHVDGPLFALAPFVGIYGIGALAAAVAASLVGCLHAIRLATPRARAGSLVGHALLIALPFALAQAGDASNWASPAGDPLAVRLHQGNVGQSMKFDPVRAQRAIDDYLTMVDAQPAQLHVLPETAWIMPIQRTAPERWHRLLDSLARQRAVATLGAPMPAQDLQRTGRPRVSLTNSMVSIAADGRAINRYDKQHLVPFGEFIPFGFAWFVNLMNIPLGEFGRGTATQAPLELAGQRIAFNICYEDLFSELIGAQVREGRATILVNASNIAWFGMTHALPQHLAISRMRAREFARPMLRATNTGMTAWIDHHGQVRGMLPPYEQGVLDAPVQGIQGLTPYARHGQSIPIGLLIAGLLVGIRRRPLGSGHPR